MILILGGTTEGRMAIETIDEAGKRFFYSTRYDNQQVECNDGIRISGKLTAETMASFCTDNGIMLIVDAAHPFASQLHENAMSTSKTLSIPIIRFERTYPQRSDDMTWCEDYDDAIDKMTQAEVKRLLALTGVQTIGKLRKFWSKNDTFFRILDRDVSRALAKDNGFPPENLIYYNDDTSDAEQMAGISPDAIITKESGISGKFQQKVDAALSAGIKIFVVKRPQLPSGYDAIVTGEHGLRRAIERLLPSFYHLRSGLTTGTCAAAAAKAALTTIISGDRPSEVSVTLPNGEQIEVPVKEIISHDGCARATIIKDAGDDPDVTDGCEIVAEVEITDSPDIVITGGEGIGIVTLPGLGIEIGQPAINPVPLAMIRNELRSIYGGGAKVTVSVPKGQELAQKTFNPRIGIMGGISIIGTSGIVKPFSHQAFIDAIKREMEVAIAIHSDHIILNSGARSERFLRSEFPDLPNQAFIHYGNAIGESLSLAHTLGIKNITVGLMIGKAVKLAEGHFDTHSHKTTMNTEFLTQIATQARCPESTIAEISKINLARQLWELFSPSDSDAFFGILLRKCFELCRTVYPSGNLQMLLIDDAGVIRYRMNQIAD